MDLLNSEYFVEVYTDKETIVYKTDSSFAAFNVVDYVPNFYQQVPINVFILNDERESIFDKVMSLQDAYNILLSNEIDDFMSFVMAYLVLQGIDDVDPDALHLMRTNRVLQLPEGGSASFLTKNIADTQIENMLENIKDTIREIAACPNFNDDAFGTSSGVAIRYKLLNFENRAGQIEKQMTLALQRRIELICTIGSIVNGEEVWRDVQIIFTRNLPVDYQDLTSMINQLRGLVSNKTLIAQLPFVQDVDAEMDAINEENATNASLYNLTSFGTNNDSEEQFMSAYWRDRLERQKNLLLGKSIDETNSHLATIYKSSIRDIEKDMKALLFDIKKEDGVKINDLYRYNRFWEMRSDINKRLTTLGQKQIEVMDKDLTDMYMRVQQYFNENPKFLAHTITNGRAERVRELSMTPVDLHDPIVSLKANEAVNSLWCADGLYWNDRVWNNMALLQDRLEAGITDIIVRGTNPDELIVQLAKEQGQQAFTRSERLVRTELSHIYNYAAAERYAEAGCNGYEWLTARDERVCEECEELDGRFFPFGNESELPPVHPNCLCTIIPVIGGDRRG